MRKELIKEDKFDNIVRHLVKDIISLFKFQREGEFGLPEDLNPEELVYSFPKLDTEFSIFLDLRLDENTPTVDVDADYYNQDDMIYIMIKSNPNTKNEILQELTGELNEVLRHELEHIKQNEEGLRFPKEPKNPELYYTQKHEIEAQRKGFQRRAKQEKKDFESLVRNWFEKNEHKHNLTKDQIEFVVNKIISDVK